MKSKPFLIAIAAFAVTASGAQAFGGTAALERAGLSSRQITAFEIAREKREAGDKEGARDILLDAGIDENVIRQVHEASHEVRAAIHTAVVSNDYEAFLVAVKDTPLAEVIESEPEFERFIQAHTLRSEGKYEEAKDIFDELGLEPRMHHGMGRGDGAGTRHHFDVLTDDQREALRVAHEANDSETVTAILEEAGIEMPSHKGHR